MQEKNNITQLINIFLCREEPQTNKYKPGRTSNKSQKQVKVSEASRKPKALSKCGKVQVGQAKIDKSAMTCYFIIICNYYFVI